MQATKRGNVTGRTMNAVYDMLREMSIEQLQEAERLSWAKFAGKIADGDLFRHQVAFTIERKLSGRW